MCHPDTVNEDRKEEATNIFKELNEAYSMNNLNKVKEILNNLEQDIQFNMASDSLNDSELLKLKINDIRKKLNILQNELDTLINSDTYKILSHIDNLDYYFNNLKQDFEDELKQLNKQIKITPL